MHWESTMRKTAYKETRICYKSDEYSGVIGVQLWKEEIVKVFGRVLCFGIYIASASTALTAKTKNFKPTTINQSLLTSACNSRLTVLSV